jgi:hypothetical protein
MSDPTTAPDLRTLAVEAMRSVAHNGPFLTGPSRARRLATGFADRLADAVLAAVLPAHRRQVLDEVIRTFETGGECDCRHRERNATLDPGDRGHEGRCAFWAEPSDSRAATIIRRLAATGPADGPSEPLPAERGEVVPQATPRPSGPLTPAEMDDLDTLNMRLFFGGLDTLGMRRRGELLRRLQQATPGAQRPAEGDAEGYQDFIAAEHFTEGPTYLDLVPRADLDRLAAQLAKTLDALAAGSALRERFVERVTEAEAQRDRLAETIRRVRELHSPEPGWDREWKDPTEALAKGWPLCRGCKTGSSARRIEHCPTLAALGDADQTGDERISAHAAASAENRTEEAS